MENNNNSSGVNTLLVVVVLVLVVGFGVWYFSGGFGGNAVPEDENAEFNINMEVPTGGNIEGGGDEPVQ